MAVTNVNYRDSEIVQILKLKLFRDNRISEDDERQKVLLLQELFSNYSKLRRVPKLITKILTAVCESILENTTDSSFSDGYIDSVVLETFSQCVIALPFGQTFEIWESFVDAYQKIDFLKSNSLYQGGSVLIAQLFSTFLLHARLFENATLPIIQGKISVLMKKTHQLLRTKSHILSTDQTEVKLHKLSFLLMVYAYNEIKLVFYVLSKDMNSFFSIEVQDDCFQFDVISSYTFLEVCTPLIRDDTKCCGYIAFKLLLQEIKAIVVTEEMSTLDKKYLKSIVSLILESTISSTVSSYGEFWDLNINSVNVDNYGVAFWNLFLGHIPLFLKFINDKKLILLCSAMIEVLISKSEKKLPDNRSTSMKSSILKFITSSFFSESKAFQTAFVTAIWKYCSSLLCAKKRSSIGSSLSPEESEVPLIFQELYSSRHEWKKYAETTPKSSGQEEANSMWLIVKTVADILNKLLMQSPILPGKLKLSEMHNLLEVLNFLQLEHLLPSNQMRCMLGLSTVFFLLGNSYSSNDNDAVHVLLKGVLRLFVSMFEGVRSIWLFDFVHAVPYLKAVIFNMEKMGYLDNDENCDLCTKFFVNLFNISTRNAQAVLAIEDYISELINSACKSRVSALAFQCLLQRLVQLLQRTYMQPQYRETCEKLAEHACYSVAKSIRCLKNNKPNVTDIRSAILSYRGLILLAMNPACKLGDEKRKKWFKRLDNVLEIAFKTILDSCDKSEDAPFFDFICTVCSHKSDLYPYMSSDFSIKTWKCVQSVLTQKSFAAKDYALHLAVNESEKRKTVTHDTAICCHFCCDVTNDSSVLDSESVGVTARKSLPSDSLDLSEFISKSVFMDSEKKMLVNLIKTSSQEEFETIYLELSKDIDQMPLDIGVIDAVDLSIQLSILSCLFDSVSETQVLLMSKIIQKCLMNVHFIMSQTCANPTCLLLLVVPSLKFISSVLKKGKNNLPKQSIVQCLHSCIAVKAEACVDQPLIFIQVYTALWSVLNELVVNHMHIVLSSIPAFVPCTTYLLKLVIHANRQDLLSNYDSYIQQKILLCVQNLDRLFGSIAKHKKELSKVVPYIIADYVDLVQNVTIHPSAKAHLITGINRLLDICSEESLRMLAININHSCREIFNSLVKNYKQYRFVGQI